MNLESIMTVVGKLGLQEYLLRNNIDEKIAKHAKLMGAEVFSRPKKLATDNATVESGMLDLVKRLKNNENFVPDIVVLLQNTSPLRTSKHIDSCLKKLISQKLDSIISASESKAFVWQIKNNNEITPITYDPNRRMVRQVMGKKNLLENGANKIVCVDFDIFLYA